MYDDSLLQFKSKNSPYHPRKGWVIETHKIWGRYKGRSPGGDDERPAYWYAA